MKNYTEEEIAEIVIRTLVENSVDPTEEFSAAAGSDYGYVAAYELADNKGYAIQHGDNGETHYSIWQNTDDLAAWLESDMLDTLDTAIQTANVRGIDALTDADTDEMCAVLIARHYYGPKSDTRLAVDEHENTLEFAGTDAAKAWIAEQDEETYYLSHNESSRPTYKIVSI